MIIMGIYQIIKVDMNEEVDTILNYLNPPEGYRGKILSKNELVEFLNYVKENHLHFDALWDFENEFDIVILNKEFSFPSDLALENALNYLRKEDDIYLEGAIYKVIVKKYPPDVIQLSVELQR